MRLLAKKLLVCLVVLALCMSVSARYRPAVILHGIGADKSSMDALVGWIKNALPGIYVRNCEIGDGWDTSWFTNMEHQVNELCTQLAKDPELQMGFNLLGYSQGGMITRGYIERCNNPPVYNFISMGSPQFGQYGTPIFNLKWVDELISKVAYEKWFQDKFSAAGYWRDPFQLDSYVKNCQFLPDINNERDVKNPVYKQRILSLHDMVLIYSTNDQFIRPPQSGWFSQYAKGTLDKVVPLFETDFYKGDWIGLRTLQETGRLHFYTASCRHQDYPAEPNREFFVKNILQYFDNQV